MATSRRDFLGWRCCTGDGAHRRAGGRSLLACGIPHDSIGFAQPPPLHQVHADTTRTGFPRTVRTRNCWAKYRTGCRSRYRNHVRYSYGSRQPIRHIFHNYFYRILHSIIYTVIKFHHYIPSTSSHHVECLAVRSIAGAHISPWNPHDGARGGAGLSSNAESPRSATYTTPSMANDIGFLWRPSAPHPEMMISMRRRVRALAMAKPPNLLKYPRCALPPYASQLCAGSTLACQQPRCSSSLQVSLFSGRCCSCSRSTTSTLHHQHCRVRGLPCVCRVHALAASLQRMVRG